MTQALIKLGMYNIYSPSLHEVSTNIQEETGLPVWKKAINAS